MTRCSLSFQSGRPGATYRDSTKFLSSCKSQRRAMLGRNPGEGVELMCLLSILPVFRAAFLPDFLHSPFFSSLERLVPGQVVQDDVQRIADRHLELCGAGE